MLNAIPFTVPDNLLARFTAGEIDRYGTILKDVGTGRIVGHLQETGLARELMSHLVGSGIPTPFSLIHDVVDTVVGMDTNQRVRQVANQLTQLQNFAQSLQVLQIANLAVSAVSVGVTIAGFVYVHRRLNALDRRLDLVLETMEAGFDAQRKMALRRQLSRVQGLARRAQDAQHSPDATLEFREVAAALADQAAYFSGEVQFITTTQGAVDADLFRELVQALMLCNSVRIDCHIRTNALRHALSVSESVASDYERLFDPLTPMSFPGLPLDGAVVTVETLRDATDAAASKPYLIDTLRTRGIPGDRYIDTLGLEMKHPLLVLHAT